LRNIISNKYIRIDAIQIVAFLVTLHGLLFESDFTRRPYITYFKSVTILCIVIFWIIALIQNKPYARNVVYLLIPCLVGYRTATKMYNENIIFLLLLMFLCRRDTIDKIIKVAYCTTKVFFWIHFFIFFVSRIVPIGVSDNFLIGEMGMRYYFFTTHPNTIARIFIFYIALSCFVYNLDLSIFKWLIIFTVTVVLYYLTKSDAVYLIFVCFLLSHLAENEKVDKMLTYATKYGIPFFLIFSLSLAWSLSIPFLYQFLKKLDLMMSYRLTSNLKALSLYSPTFLGQNSVFGKEFVYQGVTYNYIYADNMYIYTVLHWGIFYLLLMAILLFLTAEKLDFKSKMMIIVLLLYGIGENGVTPVYVSYSLLIAYSVLIKSESKKISIHI